MMRVAVTAEPFSPDTEIARFVGARGAACGAAATFVGYCRGASQQGEVTRLELEHYPGFTESEVGRLTQTVAERHGVSDILVMHRFGAISPGEPIVLVAALSPHRAAAFAAVEELMDYLKTDAPFWKKEVGPDGAARWIEPTAEDRRRREEHTQ